MIRRDTTTSRIIFQYNSIVNIIIWFGQSEYSLLCGEDGLSISKYFVRKRNFNFLAHHPIISVRKRRAVANHIQEIHLLAFTTWMDRLIAAYPSLEPHIIRTRLGEPCRPTINYFNPESVRALNTALLVADYNVNPQYNEILPHGALSPPVPGRADYVHYIADVLKQSWPDDVIPTGVNVVGMDIGTGASAIYPTIATAVYGWKMIASEINSASIESAKLIAHANDSADLIDVRHQQSKKSIFYGVLQRGEKIDFAMCNPPFYSSIEAFQKENARKLAGLAKGGSSLKEQSIAGGSNNFGGTDSELWCEGGEVAFVKRMINESKQYADKCLWFSSLVSRKDNIKRIEGSLFNMGKNKGGKQRIQVKEVRRIAMGAGHKSSTILLWTYFDEQRRTDWARMRWC